MRSEKVGIIGSGLIGRAWSMLFASVGYQVMLYDILPQQIETALTEIRKQLTELEERKQLRGPLKATEQFACISSTNDMRDLVSGAVYIQECIPERIDWKRDLYRQLDDALDEATIVGSSTSTFMPSLFSDGLQHQGNILVAHPLNPPYFIPLVELVPAPWTKPETMQRVRDLMLEIGQKPVTLRRQCEGFATNRIQYAILNEIWHLLENGVLSVADVDAVMSHGLGLRYALLGPVETAHLNADGFADYVERFGKEIYAVSSTYEPVPRMAAGETLSRIAAELEEITPRHRLPERRAQRDEFLNALWSLKKDFS